MPKLMLTLLKLITLLLWLQNDKSALKEWFSKTSQLSEYYCKKYFASYHKLTLKLLYFM